MRGLILALVSIGLAFPAAAQKSQAIGPVKSSQSSESSSAAPKPKKPSNATQSSTGAPRKKTAATQQPVYDDADSVPYETGGAWPRLSESQCAQIKNRSAYADCRRYDAANGKKPKTPVTTATVTPAPSAAIPAKTVAPRKSSPGEKRLNAAVPRIQDEAEPAVETTAADDETPAVPLPPADKPIVAIAEPKDLTPVPAPGTVLATGAIMQTAATVTVLRDKLSDLTPLEQKIGQMVMLEFDGQSTKRKDVQNLLKQAEQGWLSGLRFRRSNIVTPEQVRALTGAFNNLTTPEGFLLAAEQTGGEDSHFPAEQGFTQYPSTTMIGRSNNPFLAHETYHQMAGNLTRDGFNLNLGPRITRPDAKVNDPAFAADETSSDPFVKAFIYAHHDAGVLTALGYFPAEPVADLSEKQRETLLRPYRGLLKQIKGDIVLLRGPYRTKGIAATTNMTVGSVLRSELGYDGVVMATGIELPNNDYPEAIAYRLQGALLAGADMLLIYPGDNEYPNPAKQAVKGIRWLVDNNRISVEQIEKAYARITELKKRRVQLAADYIRRLALKTSSEIAASPKTATSVLTAR